MTEREILTHLVSSYIQGTGKLPPLTEDGNLPSDWICLVEAICNEYEDSLEPIDDDFETRASAHIINGKTYIDSTDRTFSY